MAGLTAENVLDACVKLLGVLQSDKEDARQWHLSARRQK
jgi:hypothetical protein